MIGKVIKFRLKDTRKLAIIELVAFIFGTIILTLIVGFGGGEKTVELGTMMMGLMGIGIMFFSGTIGLRNEFNLMIGMGVTRKKFISGYFISSVIITLQLLALVYIGYFIESLEIQLLYSDYEKIAAVETFLFSWYVIPAVLFIAAFTMFLGAVAVRGGKKVMVVFWCLWMAGCLLPGRIEDAMESDGSSILYQVRDWYGQFITVISGAPAIIALFVLSAAAVAAAYALIRSQRVTV